MKQWYVYILASQRNGTLYIGVTNNLARRGDEHIEGATSSFTNKYRVHNLVYYDTFNDPEEAIRREKNMKAWKRAWKIRAIEEFNSEWNDLAVDLLV